MSLKESLRKTTIANICSAVIVLGGFAYGIYKDDVDLIKWAFGIGLGYLFGYTAKKA